MHYGTGLKKVREQLGLTQYEFAKQIGVTQVVIARLERHLHHVSPGPLKKLWQRYQIPASFVALLSIDQDTDIPDHLREEFNKLFPCIDIRINHLLTLL